jgi:hypothetical protein
MDVPTTHFAQIPVAKVKEIAKPLLGDDSEQSMDAGVEKRSSKLEWRELAQKIEHEKDPAKLVHLVQKMICLFDAEKMQHVPVIQRSNKPQVAHD